MDNSYQDVIAKVEEYCLDKKLGEGQVFVYDEAKLKDQCGYDAYASMIIKKEDVGDATQPEGCPDWFYVKKQETTGGSISFPDNCRIKLAKAVERRYEQYLDNPSLTSYGNVYRTVSYLLLEYIKRVDKKDEFKDKICATARATFYNIVRPYSMAGLITEHMLEESGIHNLDELSAEKYEELSQKATMEEYHTLIGGFTDEEKVNAANARRLAVSQDILPKLRSTEASKFEVIKAYREYYKKENHDEMLYRDLLTMFCYVSAMNEAEDPSFFKYSFKFMMKHIFNHSNSFTEAENNIIYDMVLFHHLLRSDVLFYTPRATRPAEYPQRTPEPGKSELFTVQFCKELNEKRGGGVVGGWLGSL